MDDPPANVRQGDNIHSDPVHHQDQSKPTTCQEDQLPNPNQPSQTTMPPLPPITSSTSHSSSTSSSGRHPIYRGIRCRAGKWVSEIREPRKTTRIWLGTYPLPEMAAAAYDVAALALKGSDAILNFPDSVSSYPVPQSASPSDIRAAAAAAAASRATTSTRSDQQSDLHHQSISSTAAAASVTATATATATAAAAAEKTEEEEFIDEEALFDMPKLLVNMAEGMLVSPPRINSPGSDDDSPEDSDGQSLWNYF